MSSITQVNLGTMTSPAAGSTINGPSLVKDLDPVITKIESTEEYMHYLQGFSASMLEQKQAGYIVQQLSITDLNKKIRCQRCHARCGSFFYYSLNCTSMSSV